MGNTKHTPGIWSVDGFNTVAVIAQMPHTIGSNYPAYQHVCTCDYGYTEPEINVNLNKANAKLIAAAPELLEALQAVLPYLKAVGTNGNHWVPQVESAIKKATE